MFKKIWKKILKFISYGTNLREHMLAGFMTGFIGSIILLNLNLGQKPLWTLFFAMNFFYFTILFELYQLIKSKKSAFDYFTNSKIKDTILDIVVGNVAFLLPFVGISLGTFPSA